MGDEQLGSGPAGLGGFTFSGPVWRWRMPVPGSTSGTTCYQWHSIGIPTRP